MHSNPLKRLISQVYSLYNRDIRAESLSHLMIGSLSCTLLPLRHY